MTQVRISGGGMVPLAEPRQAEDPDAVDGNAICLALAETGGASL
jgi:hypothetical protein